MREITIDGKEIRVRANPLALLFYRQEFKTDFFADWEKFRQGLVNKKQDIYLYMQIIWALAKGDSPKNFPSFEKWLEQFGSWDVSDPILLRKVVEEVVDGFFRWNAEHLIEQPSDDV